MRESLQVMHWESEDGRELAAETLWSMGQPDFKSYEEFRDHTFAMADEAGGKEITIYQDRDYQDAEPVGYIYMLASKSWHRKGPGLDVSVLVVKESKRNDPAVSRSILRSIDLALWTTAEEHDLKWYSRVKHQGPVDVIITKEFK